jgi:glutathione synthase/RimK-type ligase-like ATP-grasp enzyme
MNKLVCFDVLIVYNHGLAFSASDGSTDSLTPFSHNSPNDLYNLVYGYFLEICHQHKLTAAFTTSADIVGAGHCRSFWQFKNKLWSKVNSPCFSTLIFDKFSPTKKRGKLLRQLLFSSPQVKPFNDPDLFNLFFDKQKTYQKLSKHSIPTISLVNNDIQSIKNACVRLAKLTSLHKTSADFSTDIVMKDRFGAGGRRIYKFKKGQSKDMQKTIRKNTNISYIIQPFTKFDKGFTYHNQSAPTDVRLIYLKGKIIQSYIRVAKSDEFRCNEHQGGQLTYLSLSDIPPSLIVKSNLIAKLLDKKHSLFTLDFIISNNGNTYFLEGNTGPGLDWNTSLKKNEIEAKKLIKLIVEELTVRTKNQLTLNTPQSN